MKIEILYPEVCNLYGDLANAEYLSRSSGAEIVTTSLKERPRFPSEDIALVYMGTTTERGQELVRDAFAPWLGALKERTAQGGLTLITGNALEIFGEYIQDEEKQIPMLGLFPSHAERHMMARFNSLYLGKYGEMDIVGFKSQFGHSYGDNGEGLFTTVRGPGLNPEIKPEGFRQGNLMATYLVGPLAILNPPFAKELLHLMGVAAPRLECEDIAYEAYQIRVREFSDPNRGFTY